MRRALIGWVALLGAVANAGCRDPTQITVLMTTDVPCPSVLDTNFRAAAEGMLQSPSTDLTFQRCEPRPQPDDNWIGSIVAVPRADRNARVALQVATAVGASAVTDCLGMNTLPQDCIVARRLLSFIPHTPLELPVPLRAICAGVECPEDQTCENGVCKRADVDPCVDDSGCGGQGQGGAGDGGVLTPSWTHHIAATGPVTLAAMAADRSGGVYLAGTYQGLLEGTGAQPPPAAPLGNRVGLWVAHYLEDGSLGWLTPGSGVDAVIGDLVVVGGSVAVVGHGRSLRLGDVGGTIADIVSSVYLAALDAATGATTFEREFVLSTGTEVKELRLASDTPPKVLVMASVSGASVWGASAASFEVVSLSLNSNGLTAPPLLLVQGLAAAQPTAEARALATVSAATFAVAGDTSTYVSFQTNSPPGTIMTTYHLPRNAWVSLHDGMGSNSIAWDLQPLTMGMNARALDLVALGMRPCAAMRLAEPSMLTGIAPHSDIVAVGVDSLVRCLPSAVDPASGSWTSLVHGPGDQFLLDVVVGGDGGRLLAVGAGRGAMVEAEALPFDGPHLFVLELGGDGTLLRRAAPVAVAPVMPDVARVASSGADACILAAQFTAQATFAGSGETFNAGENDDVLVARLPLPP